MHEATGGFVYIITNPAWPGWVKFGSSENLKVRSGAYMGYSPLMDYSVEHSVECVNYKRVEGAVLDNMAGMSAQTILWRKDAGAADPINPTSGDIERITSHIIEHGQVKLRGSREWCHCSVEHARDILTIAVEEHGGGPVPESLRNRRSRVRRIRKLGQAWTSRSPRS